MAETSSHRAERFTGPRRPRYSSLTEARKRAELPAGEFEIVHDTTRRKRLPAASHQRQDR